MKALDVVVEANVEVLTILTNSILGGQFSSAELNKDEISMIEACIKYVCLHKYNTPKNILGNNEIHFRQCHRKSCRYNRRTTME